LLLLQYHETYDFSLGEELGLHLKQLLKWDRKAALAERWVCGKDWWAVSISARP